MIILPFFFLILSGITIESTDSASTSASLFEKELEAGVEAFYQAEWDEAEETFNRLILDHPEDPAPYFFRSMIPFWIYFFAGEEADAADDFLEQSERVIEIAEQKLETNPNDTTAVLMLSGLYGYRSLVSANEGHYRTAMQSGVSGYSYSRKLMNMESDDPNALIGQGVFNYMVGSIPRSLQWLSSVAGVSGNKEKGFELLEKAGQDGSKVANDARMILTYLYLEEEKPSEALRVIKPLADNYPDNPIFQFYLARSYEETGKASRADEVYHKVVELDHPDLQKLKELSRERLMLGDKF